MKWFAAILSVFFLAAAGHVGFAAISLGQIVSTVRSGDGAAVLARTNLPRLRHMLVDQIVDVYLDEQGRKRKVSALQRMALNAYGSMVANGIVAKIITPSNLTVLLHSGTIREGTNDASIVRMAPLGGLDVDHTFSLLRRFEFVKPVEFSIMLGKPEDGSAVNLHFENWRWVISGVRLPKNTVLEIVRKLPSL